MVLGIRQTWKSKRSKLVAAIWNSAEQFSRPRPADVPASEEVRALLKERLLAKLDDAEKAYDAGEYVDGDSFIADVKAHYSL